jgi:intracellular septation protein
LHKIKITIKKNFMNKSLIKFITDFGPLLIFFIFYKKYGMEEAIIPLILATAVSVVVIYISEKKIPLMPLIGAVLVGGFGGLTIYFQDKTFFYMKPTIINLLFALVLLYGQLILKTSFLKKILGESLKLTEEGWNILTNRWVYFFIFLAILNELIWRTQTEELWVKFKVFGILPITFIFTIFQISIINKHKIGN